ncbi:MAG: CHAT domain-containing protein, partial [Rhodomicrobium sp.]|nr:CHAT domain-containing protein [Rhodomicrobium sp.]
IAGRCRRRGHTANTVAPDQLHTSIERTTSVAEAFLLNGISHYIGTYWPVSDRSAEIFASTFYNSLIGGDAIGKALRKSRQALKQSNQKDWANYMHYGWPKSRIRELA